MGDPRRGVFASVSPRRERLATVDSTNAEAMRRLMAGERGPLWIMADAQTAGRGRSGRDWASRPGNLLASLLVTLPVPPARAYQLALVAGVAVHDSLTHASAAPVPELRLKWPNDILIAGEKTGGILIESSSVPGHLGVEPAVAAVIGIGLNVASAPEGLDRPVTRLAAHGICPAPEALLDALADAMSAWIGVWMGEDGFAVVREAWLNRAHPIGERMSINTGSERVSGVYLGLDPEGALRLATDAGPRRFTYGDVSLDGPAPAREFRG